MACFGNLTYEWTEDGQFQLQIEHQPLIVNSLSIHSNNEL